MSIETTAERLVAYLGSLQSVAVAFSAGVDSTVVAKAAQLALGPQAIAFTADSPSLARRELNQAGELAALIGIRHEVLATTEIDDPAYAANNPDRCYHCKSHLYDSLSHVAGRFDFRVIVNGTNVDDLDDYRPGLQAAAEFEVRSPLAECDVGKNTVRELAAYWQLPVWDKPAMPCLSSRIAYGSEVTPQRLKMIELAEEFLREQGLAALRVRFHEGDLARLEIPVASLPTICDPSMRRRIVARLREIGFRFVTLDLEGFRSGSLNTMLSLETLEQAARNHTSHDK
jgi:uncharacterized protein